MALVDGSVYSQSVCDHAAWAASHIGASIDLLHVLGRRDVSSTPIDFSGTLDADARDSLLVELASLDEQKAKLAQKRGRLILDHSRSRLVAAGIADVNVKLRNGDLVGTVQEFEATSDLIVIGKRGEAADFATLHLGSNLERVVRASHKPVLVASRAFKPVERMLVAFDGGSSSLKAIDYIATSPIFKAVACKLLAVAQDSPEGRTRLDEAALKLRNAGLQVDQKMESGQPEMVIAHEVEREGIDLLAMGAYGHSRIRSLIIGSTTTQMIRSCKIPVMLFR